MYFSWSNYFYLPPTSTLYFFHDIAYGTVQMMYYKRDFSLFNPFLSLDYHFCAAHSRREHRCCSWSYPSYWKSCQGSKNSFFWQFAFSVTRFTCKFIWIILFIPQERKEHYYYNLLWELKLTILKSQCFDIINQCSDQILL